MVPTHYLKYSRKIPRHIQERNTSTRQYTTWVQYVILVREVLTLSPCEYRIDTDVNSHADKTVMESYANRAVSWRISKLSASTPTSGRLLLQYSPGQGDWRKTAERLMAKWNAAEKVRAGLWHHAVVCSNVREEPRRGQPKTSVLVLVRSA